MHSIGFDPETSSTYTKVFFFFEREISLIEGQTASTIGIKVKQDTIKQD